MPDICLVARRPARIVCAWQAVQSYLDTLEIATMDRSGLQCAQVLSGANSVDNVQLACAELNNLDPIVTRDFNYYAGSIGSAWSQGECRQRRQTGRTVQMQLKYSLTCNGLLIWVDLDYPCLTSRLNNQGSTSSGRTLVAAKSKVRDE